MLDTAATPATGRSLRRRGVAAAAALLAFVAGLAALDIAITLRSEEFKRAVIGEIGRVLDADVTIGSALFDPTRGLVLAGLELRPRPGAAPSLLRLRCDVVVRPRYRALLGGRIEIARVLVRPFEARVARDPESGTFSFENLVRPGSSATSPFGRFEVELRDAEVVVSDPTLLAPGTWLLVSSLSATAESGSGRVHVRGAAAADVLGPVDFVAELDLGTGDVSATIGAPTLVVGEELAALFAEPFAGSLERLGAAGPASASASVAWRAGLPADVSAVVELQGLALRAEAFPYPLSALRGVLRYSAGRLSLVGLAASHDAARFELSGEIVWPESGPPEASLDARVNALPIDDQLERALPEDGREVFEILRPEGTVDVALRIDGALRGAEPPAIRFDVDLFDTSLTYVGTYHEPAGRRLGFPYRINRVSGSVRNDGSETRVSLSGYAGHAPFTLEGRLYGNPLDPGVDLVVDAKSVVLDETLRAALNDDAREEWDRFHPTGIADVRCRIWQDPGSKTNTDTHVTLRGAAAEFVDFPYPLSGLSGAVRIVNADVFVDAVSGRAGETAVRVDGTFYGTGISAAHSITVAATDVTVDSELTRAVRRARPEIADRLEEAKAEGLTDVVYREVRSAFEETETRIEARMKNIRLRPMAVPILLADLRGTLVFTDSGFDIEGVTGTFGERSAGGFRADGRIDSSPGGGELSLVAEAAGVPLDEDLRTAIGIGAAAGGPISLVAARVFDTLRPSGVVGIRGALAGTLDAPRPLRVSLDLAGTRIAPPALPYGVESEAGEIAIEADGAFRLSLSRGRFGLATIERLSVTGRPLADGVSLTADAGVFGLPIEPALLSAVTGLLPADIDAMRPGGRLDVDRFHAEAEWSAGELTIDGRGRVELADARIEAGVALSSIRGIVDVHEFHRDAGGYLVSGRFEALSADLLNARLAGVGGRIRSVPHYVELEDIAGSIYGGTIDAESSRLTIHTSSPADYMGRLKIRGVDLEALASALSPKEPEYGGIADVDLEFRKGSGTGASSVIARGEIDVKEGRLVEVPFVAAILKVFAWPVTPTYTTAFARFRLRRSKFMIDELRFGGAPISLEGYGRFDLDGTLDLLLVIGLPRILAIPIVDDLVKLVSQSLVAIRVAGPSDNPRVFVENVVTEGFAPDLGPVRRPKGLSFEVRRRPAEW